MPIKLPRLNLALFAIVAEGFFSRLSFGLVSFALPLYAHHLGLSLSEIGMLASLNVAVGMLLMPAMGWLADRWGLKKTFVVAVGVRSLVALSLIFAATPWHLYTIRSLHGVSKSLRDPSADALIAEHGGKKAIASAFAWYQTAKSTAGSLGKALAGLLLTLTMTNFALVFGIAFALSALPLYVVVRHIPPVKRQNDPARPDTTHPAPPAQAVPLPLADKKPQPALLPFMGLGFLVNGTAQMLNGLFPLLATEYAGLSEAETGLIYLASTLVILVSGPLFGWLSDNVSRRLVLMVRGIANTSSSALYLLAPSFLGIAIGRAIDDLGKAAFRPAWGALMAQVSSYDPQKRALTMSWLSLGEDAGNMMGPILAGFLWSTYGVPALLGARILLALLTEGYALLITDRLKQPAEEREAPGMHYARGDSHLRK